MAKGRRLRHNNQLVVAEYFTYLAFIDAMQSIQTFWAYRLTTWIPVKSSEKQRNQGVTAFADASLSEFHESVSLDAVRAPAAQTQGTL